MTTLLAPQKFQKAKTPDNIAYENIKKLCPDLSSLQEGDYVILKSKLQTAPDVTIGCKHLEKGEFPAIYEICSQHGETKVSTVIEASHKNKTASTLIYETNRAGEKKLIEAKDTTTNKLNDLFNDLSKKGYIQQNIQTRDNPR